MRALLRRVVMLLLVAIGLMTLPACEKLQQARDASAAFDEFQRAYAAERYDEVWSMLSSSAHDDETRLLDVATRGTRREIDALSPGEKYELTIIRMTMSSAELATFDAYSWFMKANEEGWYGEDDGYEWTLRNVHVGSGWARGTIYIEGYKTDLECEMVQEDGAWKFDYAAITAAVDRYIREGAANSGMTIDEAIINLVENEIGEYVPRDIWDRVPETDPTKPWWQSGGG